MKRITKVFQLLKNNKYLRSIALKANWQRLALIGRSRFVKSFSIWLIITPVLAKFLSKLPDSITFPLLDKKISFIIGLPFSVSIFYICACLFSLGSIIFNLKCPSLIKSHKDFPEYLNKNGSTNEICVSINELDETKKQSYYSKYNFCDLGIDNATLSNIYFDVTRDLKLKHVYTRVLLSAIYLLAFVLMFILFLQNSLFVLGKM